MYKKHFKLYMFFHKLLRYFIKKKIAYRVKGLFWWLSGKEYPYQCGRQWLDLKDPLGEVMATHSSFLAMDR